MFQNLIDILAAPAAVFKRLQARPSILFPLLLVLLATTSIQIGYFYLTDFSYLIDQLVEQALANNANARESEIRAAMGNLSPTILAISGGVGTPIVLLLIYALYASYLNFVAKFGLQEYTFKHWFSLMCWTNIPTVFTAIAAWVVILSSANGQVSQSALQPLSIDSLLALNTGKTLLQYLSLPQLWSMVLLVLGYQHFTGKPMLKSATIALAPTIIIFGSWALISLL